MADWYKVSKRVTFSPLDDTHHKDLYKSGAASILNNKHHSSPSSLLSTVYPDYDWLPWKFYTCPRHYWEDIKNQRKFMDWVGKQLSVQDMSDWYNVSFKVT
jgi:hypothetical protein